MNSYYSQETAAWATDNRPPIDSVDELNALQMMGDPGATYDLSDPAIIDFFDRLEREAQQTKLSAQTHIGEEL